MRERAHWRLDLLWATEEDVWEMLCLADEVTVRGTGFVAWMMVDGRLLGRREGMTLRLVY